MAEQSIFLLNRAACDLKEIRLLFLAEYATTSGRRYSLITKIALCISAMLLVP